MRENKQTYMQAGFSLVELLVVLAIIGFVAIIAAPDLSPANARLKSAVRELYSNMQSAKMNAIKHNEPWGIIFNSAADTYSVCSNANLDSDCSDAGENEELVVDLGEYGSSVAYGIANATEDAAGDPCPGADCPADGIGYAPATSVVFQPSGLLRGLGNGYVYLQNNKNTVYAVGTPAVSGIIVTRKWANGAWQ